MAVPKATTIKEALKNLEEETNKNPAELKEIGLQFQYPPIERMDNTLSKLKKCEKLSLSTNMIEKITGLNGLKNLKILSLGRNYIKSLSGIEVLADTLEELWISYNFIEKLKPIESMKALKVFYLSNNLVKDWSEFNRLNIPSNLIDLVFIGNPLIEHLDINVYRNEVMKRLPKLKMLDGEPIIRDE